MIKTNIPISEYGNLFEITDEERNALGDYAGMWYKFINSLFVNNDGEYEKHPSIRASFINVDEGNIKSYVRTVERAIEQLPLIYKAMLKHNIENPRQDITYLYRGTSTDEVASMKEGSIVQKVISTTESAENANWTSFALENNDKAAAVIIKAERDSGLLTLNLSEIFADSRNDEKETIVAPFAKVKRIERDKDRILEHGGKLPTYVVSLEQAELEPMDKEEQLAFKESLVGNASKMFQLIASLVRKDNVLDDLEYKIEVSKTNLKTAIKEKTEVQKEYDGLAPQMMEIKEEERLLNLLKIWQIAIESTDIQSGQIDISYMRGLLESVGIRSTEFTREFEEDLKKEIRERILGLEISGRLNGKFFGNETDIRKRREDMLAKLYGNILNEQDTYGKNTSSALIGNISDARSILEEALSENYTVMLSQKHERLGRRIRELDEDIEYYRENEKTLMAEMEEVAKKAEASKPEIKAWKAGIAKLCMAKCKDVELELEAEIRQREADFAKRKEKAPNKPQNEPAKTNVVQEVIEQNSADNGAKLRQEMVASARTLMDEYDASNLYFSDRVRDISIIERHSKRLAQTISEMIGRPYSSNISVYSRSYE